MAKGVTTTTQPIVIDSIEKACSVLRRYLRDDNRYNELLDEYGGRELEQSELALAVSMTIDDWNSQPPVSTRTVVTISDYPSLALFLQGGAIFALQMAGFWRIRNKLPYRDGGMEVDPHEDKGMKWINLQRMMSEAYEQKKTQLKMYYNINPAKFGMASPYGGMYYYPLEY